MKILKFVPVTILLCLVSKMALADIHVDIDPSCITYFGQLKTIEPVLRIDGGASTNPPLYYFPGHKEDKSYLTTNEDISVVGYTTLSLADLVNEADSQHGTLNMILLYGKTMFDETIDLELPHFMPYTLNNDITVCLSVQDIETAHPKTVVKNGACQ